LTRVRELVLGFQDGLLVPLGVVTGLAHAAVGTTAVIVGGLAEAAAGALAMGTGAYLSSSAENQLIASEIADQHAEAMIIQSSTSSSSRSSSRTKASPKLMPALRARHWPIPSTRS
jgi:VIT1/CCC1 family predicted Fe2+/Mn2+ transporter